MSDNPSAEPRIRRFMTWGGWMFLIGLVLAIGGAATVAISQGTQVAFGADRAEIPEPLTFDAGGGDYQLTLLADPLAIQSPYIGGNNAVAYFLCTIDRSDGTTVEVDGGTQLSRVESDLGIEIGGFSAPAGPTTATCAFKDGRDSSFYYYSVAPKSSIVTTVGIAILVAGIAVLSLGIWFLSRAYGARSSNLKRL
mgnify:CR=1 FL=1